MSRLTVVCAATFLAFVIHSAIETRVASASDDLVKAEKILDRFVEVTGGMEAHQKIKTRKRSGTITVDAAGQEFELEMRSVAKQPNQFKIEIDLPTGVTNTKVYDGKHAWELNGQQGDALQDEKGTRQSAALSNFHGVVDWKKNYASVKTVGKDEVNGNDAFKVECKNKNGKVFFHWFDKDTGLMVKTENTMDIPGVGEVKVENFTSNYKEYDGVKLTTHSKQVIKGIPGVGEITQTYQFSKTEQNVKVDDKAFAMPDQIKELLNDRSDDD